MLLRDASVTADRTAVKTLVQTRCCVLPFTVRCQGRPEAEQPLLETRPVVKGQDVRRLVVPEFHRHSPRRQRDRARPQRSVSAFVELFYSLTRRLTVLHGSAVGVLGSVEGRAA